MAEINRTGALTFTADLSKGLVAYKATRDNRVIDLGREKFYKPEDFFESVKRSRDEGKGKLIHPDDFLLIMSREKIRLPPTHAAEIAECDPTLGDWKIHYAGLINPGHGYKHRKMCGDHIVFEVRARDFPNFLQHGQPIAKFHVYEMSDVPEQKYAGIKSTGFEDLASILPVQFKKTG